MICLLATLFIGVRNGILVGIGAALVLQALRLFLLKPIPLGTLPKGLIFFYFSVLVIILISVTIVEFFILHDRMHDEGVMTIYRGH